MADESKKLSSRFKFKFISNILCFVFGFMTVGLVPKSLGPVAFGQFHYITILLERMFFLLDFGSSTFTNVTYSKNNQNPEVFIFGLIFKIFTILVSSSFLLIAVNTSLRSVIFEIDETQIILLGFLFSVGTDSVSFVSSALDVQLETLFLEKIKLLAKLTSVIFIILAYSFDFLNLKVFIWHHIIILIIQNLFLYLRFKRYLKGFIGLIKKSGQICQGFIRSYWKYSAPLIVNNTVIAIFIVSDRWLLQIFSAPEEQGYFSFAQKLASIALILMHSFRALFLRDFSLVSNNQRKSQRLVRRTLPFMSFLTLLVSSFTFFDSERIVELVGGSKYLPAILSLKLLCIFTFLKVLAELGNVLLLGSGKTELFTKINIVLTCVFLPLTYFLVSDNRWGYNLGSTGVAIKCAVFSVINVWTIMYFGLKEVGLKIFHFLRPLICSFAVFVSIYLFLGVFFAKTNWMNFICHGGLFTIFSCGVIYLFPKFVLMDELPNFLKMKKKYL